MNCKRTMMALLVVAAAVFAASAMIVSAESDYSSADTNVAHSSTTGQDYPTIDQAIQATNQGDTVTLLVDTTLAQGNAGQLVIIDNSIIFDGGWHTLRGNALREGSQGVYPTVMIGKNAPSNISVTIKNIIINNDASTGSPRPIETRGNISSLALDNCILNITGSQTENIQPFVFGGSQSKATIDISNTVISTRNITSLIGSQTSVSALLQDSSFLQSMKGQDYCSNGYAITTFNPVSMTISNSMIAGWANLNLKPQTSSLGTQGSDFTVNDSFLYSTNIHSGPTDDYSNIKFEDDNIVVSLNRCITYSNQTGSAAQNLFDMEKYPSLEIPSNLTISLTDCNVIVAGGPQQTNLTYGAKQTIAAGSKISFGPGTYSLDPAQEPCSDNTTINLLESGCMSTENTGTNMFEVTGAAKIGDTVYSLNDAFGYANTHLGTEVTITMIGNTYVRDVLMADIGANIILQLGDFSIVGNINGKTILNYGTLTINGDNGCVYNTDITNQSNDAVTNYATLTINGGWFGDMDNDMTDTNKDINRGAAVRNLGGTVTLNGGHFTAGDNWVGEGGYAYALINGDGGENDGTMIINDGVFVYGANNGNVAVNSGTVDINGGDFKIRGSLSHYNIYLGSEKSKVTVLGGTFLKTDRQLVSVHCAAGAKIDIKGGEWTNRDNSSMFRGQAGDIVIYSGTFNKDPATYVLEGCTVTEDQGVYTVLMTVTITVDESSYGSVDKTSVSVPYGAVFTVDGNVLTINGTAVTATPAGPSGDYKHVFDGWSVQSGAVAEAPMTVTASFSEVLNSVTVTFRPNGGTGTMDPQQIVIGKPTPLNAVQFVRLDYNFVSWNTAADGSGTAYADGQTVTLTADLTLYAIWAQVPEYDYIITFVTNGGSPVAPVTVKEGDVAQKPENPTKDNSKFAGWFSDSALTVRYTFSEPVTSDLTLYAKWTDSVNVSVPSGAGYDSSPAGVTSVRIGESFSFTIAQKEGYQVTEVAADGTVLGTGPGTFTLTPKSDVSITVVFTTAEGKTVETSESTVDNDDGTVTTNATTTEKDGSGDVTITENSKTTDGTKEVSRSTATADVSGTDVNISITSTQDAAVISASLAEAIASAGTLADKDVTVTTPNKTVVIDAQAWELLGNADVTVTVNSDADFEASITVSKDSFSSQSSLTLQVAGSDVKVPPELGNTTKPFELTAKMGGNTVPGFENQVKVAISFNLPASVTAVYAYCLDDGTKIVAQFDPLTGEVIFDAPHFSTWTIIYEEPTSGPIVSTLVIALVIIIACIAIAVTSYALRKHETF